MSGSKLRSWNTSVTPWPRARPRRPDLFRRAREELPLRAAARPEPGHPPADEPQRVRVPPRLLRRRPDHLDPRPEPREILAARTHPAVGDPARAAQRERRRCPRAAAAAPRTASGRCASAAPGRTRHRARPPGPSRSCAAARRTPRPRHPRCSNRAPVASNSSRSQPSPSPTVSPPPWRRPGASRTAWPPRHRLQIGVDHGHAQPDRARGAGQVGERDQRVVHAAVGRPHGVAHRVDEPLERPQLVVAEFFLGAGGDAAHVAGRGPWSRLRYGETSFSCALVCTEWVWKLSCRGSLRRTAGRVRRCCTPPVPTWWSYGGARPVVVKAHSMRDDLPLIRRRQAARPDRLGGAQRPVMLAPARRNRRCCPCPGAPSPSQAGRPSRLPRRPPTRRPGRDGSAGCWPLGLHAVSLPLLPPRLPAAGGPARAARAVLRMPGDGPVEQLVRRAFDELPEPEPVPALLTHGDWHLGQLVRRDRRLLIDVDDLGVGDPAWDLARPAAWYAAGLLEPAVWDRFLGADQASGGPAPGRRSGTRGSASTCPPGR